MRKTTLYQQPRSPLIHGHSKTERPFWQPWLAGFLGLVIWIVLTVYVSTKSSGSSVWQGAGTAWSADLPWLLLGGLAGSAVGVLVAKLWGIRQRWILAIVAAIGGGYLASWIAWAAGAFAS